MLGAEIGRFNSSFWSGLEPPSIEALAIRSRNQNCFDQEGRGPVGHWTFSVFLEFFLLYIFFFPSSLAIVPWGWRERDTDIVSHHHLMALLVVSSPAQLFCSLRIDVCSRTIVVKSCLDQSSVFKIWLLGCGCLDLEVCLPALWTFCQTRNRSGNPVSQRLCCSHNVPDTLTCSDSSGSSLCVYVCVRVG